MERHALSRTGINWVGHDSHGVALVVEGQADDGLLLPLAVEPARGELEEEAVASLHGGVHGDAELHAVLSCGGEHVGVALVPEVERIALGIEHFGVGVLGLSTAWAGLGQSLVDAVVYLAQYLGMTAIIGHRLVELLGRHPVFL